MLATSFGAVELTDGAKELYMESGITKLQEFYGLSFNDLFDEDSLKKKGVNDKDMEYILSNRDVEFARREKESWEMRQNLFKSPEWKKLSEHYGISERDIRDIEAMKKKGVPQDAIDFITGKKPTEKVGEEPKKEKVEVKTKKTKKWAKK